MTAVASVKFEDFTIEVKSAIKDLAYKAVEESCGKLESQVKRNTAVDTRQTTNAWTHNVKSSGDDVTGTVGNPLENAIWEEFGTGEYALNGDGRKGGWAYENPKTGETVWTRGKRPRRPFFKAYSALKNKLIKHIQDVFKGGLS